MLTWPLRANSYSLGGLTDGVRLRVGGFEGVMGAKKVMLVSAAAAAPAADSLSMGVGLLQVVVIGDSGLSCRIQTGGLGVSGYAVALVADLSPSLQDRCVELAKTFGTGSVASS